jgi:hypothetical protein
MRSAIARAARQPLHLAVGSLLSVGLLVSAVMASTPTSPIKSTKPGYSYANPGQAKGHREHCPSERGRQQSKGHAVCHMAPRRGR